MAHPTPNPQGKGVVPLLQQREALLANRIKRYSGAEILGDYAVSLLVLSADFRFRPSAGQSYTLYRTKDERLGLSLIEAECWPSQLGTPIAECLLDDDMTWRLETQLYEPNDHATVQLLQAFLEQFEQRLQQTPSLDDSLPFYEEGLSFYPRLFANIMSKSLQQRVAKSELHALSGSEWIAQHTRTLLPNRDNKPDAGY